MADEPSAPPPPATTPTAEQPQPDQNERGSVDGGAASTQGGLPSVQESARAQEEPIKVEINILQDGAKWSEERIERRLRGDYERAGRALSELVAENLDTPLRLNAIRIVNAKQTRTSFLSNLLAPSLPTLPPASYLSDTPAPPSDSRPQTLRSILATTRNLTGLLSQFDIFTQVEASLESSPSALAEADDVDIVLKVKEAPRLYLRTATDVGDGEGTATATAKIRNAFGGAENVEGNISFGTRTKSAFQLKVDTPVNGSPITKADFSIFSAERDLNYFASCRESTRGAALKLKTITALGLHEFTYEAVLRKIGSVASTASDSIREAAGQSVKSSISHVVVRDTRDDPFMASLGSYLRLKQEYAGLGGDVNFIKLENEASISRSLFPGYTLSLGLRSGALLPLGGNPSLFADRFHIGGPTSVRMFRPNSMGPRDGVDYTGGDLHWAAGLSIIAPFPPKPEWPLKLHAFVNAGRLSRLDNTCSATQSALNLFSQPSVTVGAGLMYRHSIVRVEMNVGVPLVMTAQEGAVKGLQFGLGMSFL